MKPLLLQHSDLIYLAVHFLFFQMKNDIDPKENPTGMTVIQKHKHICQCPIISMKKQTNLPVICLKIFFCIEVPGH